MDSLFSTSRTNIRSFNENDLSNLIELMTDPEVMKFTGFKKPQSEQKIKELLAKWTLEGNKELGVWAVESNIDDSFIGWFMLKNTTVKSPELGFMIAKNNWGKGYATEVSKEFLRYGAQELNLGRIIASTVPENVASLRVLQKIGMQECPSLTSEGLLYFEWVNLNIEDRQ